MTTDTESGLTPQETAAVGSSGTTIETGAIAVIAVMNNAGEQCHTSEFCKVIQILK